MSKNMRTNLVVTCLIIPLILSGCAGSGSGVGGTPNSSSSLSGAVSIPSGASYAQSLEERVFLTLHSLFESAAQALTGQVPWNGAAVSLYKLGDYPMELLNVGIPQVATNPSGQYSMANISSGFYVAKASKGSGVLYSLVYPGSVISGDITSESAAAAYLTAALGQIINFDLVNTTYLNDFKTKLESDLAATFNAHPTYLPDFSNQTDVATKLGTLMTNNIIMGAITQFDVLWNDYLTKVTRHQVPLSSITSYGSGTETSWTPVSVFKSCRVGNDRYGMGGGDLVSVKLAKDATYLYVYAKMGSNIDTTTGRYEFSFVMVPNYGIGTQYGWRVKYNGSSWLTTIATNVGTTPVANSYVGTNYIEMRIPLAGISSLFTAANYPTIEAAIIDNNNLPVPTSPYLFYSDYVGGLAIIN